MFDLGCTDTVPWNNGYGETCRTYGTRQWCKNGGPLSGSEWTMGSTYNYPENNCCICGKD